ncbi:hypothetical protein BDZ94DRAFT_1260012 [Collybia nuda]|uniref:Uncharacterized protein n=1 Tax=Collybia nuda TaxID=64659 RepID=A0A9P5Y7C8_9AGAR|nr:hypothetical protein BDZ94DRAFT_1260012 [Collybia nuda]
MACNLLHIINFSAPRSVAFPSARIAFPESAPGPGTVEDVVTVSLVERVSAKEDNTRE